MQLLASGHDSNQVQLWRSLRTAEKGIDLNLRGQVDIVGHASEEVRSRRENYPFGPVLVEHSRFKEHIF